MAQVEKISASVFTIPTATPVESDGTLAWRKTTLVLAEVHGGGETGLGYTYADSSAARVIEEVLSKEVCAKDVLDIPSMHVAMLRAVRNIGRPGIAANAISAVDVALWDLKAKLLDLPLSKLLGQFRAGVPVYGSGGFTSYTTSQLQEQLGGWVSQGISRVKMKISGDIDDTLERVRAARMAIGIQPQLFVDANGAYSPKQALYLAERMAEHQVSWFEEPVSSDDLEGMAFVRERSPAEIDIAAGEYGYDPDYFERMIRAQAVDVVQIDATRCLGVTGFLQAASVCHALHKPISAHCAPQLHMHLCSAVPEVRHLEYFFDHSRIEQMLFDGTVLPRDGVLVPDVSAPGLGIRLRKREAERFAA